jgi:hypothetical protein
MITETHAKPYRQINPKTDNTPLPGAYRPQFIERRRARGDVSSWWLVAVAAIIVLIGITAIGLIGTLSHL